MDVLNIILVFGVIYTVFMIRLVHTDLNYLMRAVAEIQDKLKENKETVETEIETEETINEITEDTKPKRDPWRGQRG